MSGKTTSKPARVMESYERLQVALSEQEAATDYHKAIVAGEHGEYAQKLQRDLMALGWDAYPAADQIACATKIQRHLKVSALTGYQMGQAPRSCTKEAQEAEIDKLYGPHTRR